ncbi:hypothetical protein HYC85_014683 [Camellia sinensis]|uniref:Uncharacterized protein n=1 Tax=Camellia sinensis TaxID=4442 RepID=A0A7J7HAC6_CAMSI|nr:hypothetical protein HYC85_014683 [Camellia sinensis]
MGQVKAGIAIGSVGPRIVFECILNISESTLCIQLQYRHNCQSLREDAKVD